MSCRDSLRRLTDEQEIRDLARHYCTAVDRRDWRLLSDLFVPDATVAVPQAPLMNGNDEIVSRYRRGLSKYDGTHHMVTNHQISIEGDSARHSCLVHAKHLRAEGSTSIDFTIGGRYEDRLVRTPQGWQFTHRELVNTWTEGSSAS